MSRPPALDETVQAEITADGYLRLPGEFCGRRFPQDRAVGVRQNALCLLMPATVYSPTGMIMKQRNLSGERSILIREVWGDDHPVGVFDATWQAGSRRLVIDPVPATDSTGGDR